jgi:hypothetical protein
MYSVKSGKLFNLMPFLLGFAAIAYMGSLLAGFTGVLLEPGLANPDQILPVMLMEYAPFALASLILAAGAAAAMSTANSPPYCKNRATGLSMLCSAPRAAWAVAHATKASGLRPDVLARRLLTSSK